MTAPTPKPDEQPPARRLRIPRPAALAASACLAFTIFAVALIRVLPAPHGRADYLIAVSYTHLDVYKRQPPTGCATSMATPPYRWRRG